MNVPLMIIVQIMASLSVTPHQSKMHVYNVLITLIVQQKNLNVTSLKMYAANVNQMKLILEKFAVQKVKLMMMACVKIPVLRKDLSNWLEFVVNVN